MRNPDEKPIIVETPPAAKLETSPLKVTPEQGKEAIKLPSSEDIVSSSKGRGEELTKSAKPDAGRKINNTEEIGKAHEDEPPKELSKSKEIDPAKLKEMKREEEIAKAKLAMERKKKLAEKAAAKAEARAQKEAEKKLKVGIVVSTLIHCIYSTIAKVSAWAELCSYDDLSKRRRKLRRRLEQLNLLSKLKQR